MMSGPRRSDTTHEVTPDDAGIRLDRWLAHADRLGSRSKAAEALERGRIFLDGVEQTPKQAGQIVIAGQKVRIWIDRPGSAHRARFRERSMGNLSILHEDDDLVVVDKPAGLLTVPRPAEPDDDTVIARLERALDPARRRRLFVAHRIDQGTSGLVVVARHTKALDHLKAQFLARTPERQYLAVVHGHPEPPRGTWRDRLLDDPKVRITRRAADDEPYKEAVSNYVVTERFVEASLVAVGLVTGRRNQIRIQASVRNHPLVGETLYVAEDFESDIPFARPALHAAHLGFIHPRTDEPVEFDAPLPADLQKLIAQLSREAKRHRDR